MKRNKPTGFVVNSPLGLSVGTGIAIAVALTVLLTALLANLTLQGAVKEAQTSIWVFVIRTVAVLLGCLAGIWIGKGKHLITVGIISLGYLALVIALCIILYDGSFGNMVAGVASVLIGGIAGLGIHLIPKRNGKYNRKLRR